MLFDLVSARSPLRIVGGPPVFQASSLVSAARFDPAAIVVLGAALIWYLRARHRTLASGQTWARGHTVAFCWGLFVAAVMTMSGLATFSSTNLTVHFVCDTFVLMAVPILLGLGAPLTLAVTSAGPAGRDRLRRVLASRAVWAVTNPLSAWVLLAGGLLVYLYTPLFAATTQHRAVADLVDLGLILLGCIFAWPPLGADPLPRPTSYPIRLVTMLFTLPYFTVLGMALDSQSTPIAPGTTAGALHQGSEVLWSSGELLGIAAAIGVLVFWVRGEETSAVRRDETADDAEAEAQLALWRAQRAAIAMEDALARAPVVEARPGSDEP